MAVQLPGSMSCEGYHDRKDENILLGSCGLIAVAAVAGGGLGRIWIRRRLRLLRDLEDPQRDRGFLRNKFNVYISVM